MRSNLLIGGLLATALALPALAQSNPPAPATPAPPAATAPAPDRVATNKTFSDQWRASKLVGLNVYNDQNEKLGDISELLLDKSGKVTGVIIGVGGFLGIGQHDIKVEMDKLKFVNEPARTSSTTTTTTSSTTGAANRPATTTTSSSTPSRQWYPDHAVLSGASKDQLKAMPAFKYE